MYQFLIIAYLFTFQVVLRSMIPPSGFMTNLPGDFTINDSSKWFYDHSSKWFYDQMIHPSGFTINDSSKWFYDHSSKWFYDQMIHPSGFTTICGSAAALMFILPTLCDRLVPDFIETTTHSRRV